MSAGAPCCRKGAFAGARRRRGLLLALAVAALPLAGLGAEAAADPPAGYTHMLRNEEDLLGYWPLAADLRAGAGRLNLGSSREGLALTAGPFGGTGIDLSDGNDLVIRPDEALDAPQVSVELVFKIVKSAPGTPCLFGFRDAARTRFSLHYSEGTRRLLAWNGSAVTAFECNDELVTNAWFHLAAVCDGGALRVWVNGKPCRSPAGRVPVPQVGGLPFVLGSSAPASAPEHANIAVSHLALYRAPLTERRILAHLAAAGWTHKTEVRLTWQDCPVSLLESQIGYHPRNVKRVYLRSAQAEPPRAYLADAFSVIDTASGKEVYTGKVAKWGKKWETYWWVLDFTPLRVPGEYVVRAGRLESAPFRVEDEIFRKTDLAVIALDQLEHRIHNGLEDKRKGLAGKYVNCGPDVRIYMDCGSPYAELEPVGTCVYALLDMHELLGDRYSAADRERMIRLATMGADYFVAAQRHTDDPETDGMFHHSLLVNTRDTWAGDIFTYLDTAYGMALLARAHQFFAGRDPARAQRYLEAAQKAWELCVRRPRHTKADRTFPAGCNAFFWNAPAGIQDTFGRCLYNITDKTWTLPTALRTRDRLPFVQGSALLHEITGERKYLDKAAEFADAIMERQFTDWQNPIDGCFGTFYEFAGDDQAFFHEFMQGGFWWEGNVEALNLDGFMHLLRLAPLHPKAAAWENTIRIYAENYARRATTLNPLGVYPVACYRDREHGGIKNFQNMLFGSSCLYGFSAKNFMTLGAFLQDACYQTNAMAGVNFIAGLNPGLPNVYDKDTAWDARTLILGVGRSWFGPTGEPAETARGSVPNGFCASSQFWHMTGYTNFIALGPDKPSGLITPGGGYQFNEGWILHSHAYVQAVARLEAGYTLKLRTLDGGRPVPAAVAIVLRESAAPHAEHTRSGQAGADGGLAVTDLPTPCNGTVRVTHAGREIVRPVAAISGGCQAWEVDFAREASLAVDVPDLVTAGAQGEARVTVANAGSAAVSLNIALAAAGVTLKTAELTLALEPGEKQRVRVKFVAGDRVMPYLVRAAVAAGAPARESHATGKIRADGRP